LSFFGQKSPLLEELEKLAKYQANDIIIIKK